MDFSTLKKDQLMDIYIPSLQSYYRVKLLDVEKDHLILTEVRKQGVKDYLENGVRNSLPLDVGKIYLIYIGIDENVYCGKTRLLTIRKERSDEDIIYVLEKPEELTFQERRHGSRVAFKEKVFYRFEDSESHEFTGTAQSVDLSRGGMCLNINEYIKPKTGLVVKLRIEDIELCVKARVRWIKDMPEKAYQIGIAFQELFLPV